MTGIRTAYLHAAAATEILLAEPAVAAAWSGPSALAGFTVGGLAAHLASQVTSIPARLVASADDVPRVTVAEHYARVTWIGADLDADINVAIRGQGEGLAEAGPAAVIEQTAAAVGELRATLPGIGSGHQIRPPAGPWALSLDDFLVTRMMEIAVHSDDLACSVGLDPPPLPAGVLDPVFALLVQLAIRRHGPTAVLRGLSRAERAPASITAF